jgi:hypothetical protein
MEKNGGSKMASKSCEGYTLLSPVGGPHAKATLIDMEGNTLREWKINGSPARMLPGGSVIGYKRTRMGKHPLEPDRVQEGSRPAGAPPNSSKGGKKPFPWFDNIEMVQVSWDGQEEWAYSDYDDDGTGVMMSRQHHDYEREGNPVGYYAPGQDFVDRGKTMIIGHKNRVVPEISDKELADDVIYEIDWDGNLTGFEWPPADHFEEFGFDTSAKEAIYKDPSYMEDRGYGNWIHLNTLSLLGRNHWYEEKGDERFHPENFMISSRIANFIAIASRATGKIVWRVGPDFGEDTPEYKLGQFIGQHGSHMIPKGLPGEGNILVFDNGGASGLGGPDGYPRYRRDYSRVIEFNPVTFDMVWEYGEQSGPKRFFSPLISNAQRLPNGNTLIVVGSEQHIFEVTPDGENVWDYVFQVEGLTGIYRAYRIPPEWVPGNTAGYPEWGA